MGWLVLVLVVGVYAWALQPLERAGHPVFGPAASGDHP